MNRLDPGEEILVHPGAEMMFYASQDGSMDCVGGDDRQFGVDLLRIGSTRSLGFASVAS